LSSPNRSSRRNQPYADDRQPIAVEVARIAHRHAKNLAVVHGAAERLAAEGGVGAGRREGGVEKVSPFERTQPKNETIAPSSFEIDIGIGAKSPGIAPGSNREAENGRVKLRDIRFDRPAAIEFSQVARHFPDRTPSLLSATFIGSRAASSSRDHHFDERRRAYAWLTDR
jgi:hypothetical protein